MRKAKKQQVVEDVVKPPKKERKKKIPTTTTEQGESPDSLSGTVSVSPVTKVIKGYVNIQRNPRGGFYTGGDIHDTVEGAKRVASNNTVTQIFIAFEYK